MQSLGKEGEINQGRREMEEGDRKRGVGAMWFWKWPSTKNREERMRCYRALSSSSN